MNSLDGFKQAYSNMLDAWKKTIHLYCVCGKPFPEGEVSRVLYGTVHIADNRCPDCVAEGKGN